MTYEYSCGAVVFTRVGGVPHYLMIHQTAGHWGFPKGHRSPGETERETALREIFEETGVRVALLEGFQAVSEYDLPKKPDTRKRVVFFLAEFQDQEVRVQEAEVQNARLLPYRDALELLRHEDSRRVLTEAHAFLNT